MPIFEYECKKCNYKKDFLENMNEENEHLCPSCKEKMIKKFSVFFCKKCSDNSCSCCNDN